MGVEKSFAEAKPDLFIQNMGLKILYYLLTIGTQKNVFIAFTSL
jgi:hypothetical protein